MRKILIALAAIVLAVSCQKDDVNKIFYSGVNTDDVPEGSVFDGVYLDNPVHISNSMSAEYQAPFAILNAQAKGNDYCGRVYYGTMDEDAHEVLQALNEDEVVIIMEPNIDVIQPWLIENGYDIDLSDVRGNVLLAYTGRGEFYVINRWLKDDRLGSLNGLSTWLNQREKAKKERKNRKDNGSQEVTDLFDVTHAGFTYNFEEEDYEVAHISCSDADYLSGSGNVCVSYDVYPVHAFEGQTSSGDYYYVKMRSQVNSNGMYTPTKKCSHGGVWVHKQGFWLKEYGLSTTMVDEDGTQVGQFPFDGWPQPKTTQGSTSYSYTSGLEWNIGGGVTGGASKKDGAEFNVSVSGGVSVSNSTTETREVGDIAISNNSTQNEASYNYMLMNLPNDDNIRNWDGHPNIMAIGGCEMSQGFIFYVPNVPDASTKKFKLRISITKLLYQCHKDQSSCMNYDLYNVDLTKQVNKPTVLDLPQPNRTKTGLVKITHDAAGFGNYMFTTTASDGVNTYVLNGSSSYGVGTTISRYLPVGTYTFTTLLGNQYNTAQPYQSPLLTLNMADSLVLNTGAFSEATPNKARKTTRR